jgi:predicted RNase H-like nuclease (RuvC/YqgF family)
MRNTEEYMTRGEIWKVVGLLVTVAILLFGVLMNSIGDSKNEMREELQTFTAEIRGSLKALDKEAGSHVERITRLETEQIGVDKSIDRIETKLDSLLKTFGIKQVL